MKKSEKYFIIGALVFPIVFFSCFFILNYKNRGGTSFDIFTFTAASTANPIYIFFLLYYFLYKKINLNYILQNISKFCTHYILFLFFIFTIFLSSTNLITYFSKETNNINNFLSTCIILPITTSIIASIFAIIVIFPYITTVKLTHLILKKLNII